MTVEGRLRIKLTRQAGAVTHVEIQSSRPLQVTRLLIGKTPEQLLAMLPLLFNVCGIAQAYAGFEACRKALGMEQNPIEQQARQNLVWLETVREHCLRMLIDWPAYVAAPPDKSQLAGFIALPKEFSKALFVNGNAFSLDSRLQVDKEKLHNLIDRLEALLNQAIFDGLLTTWQSVNDAASFEQWLQQNQSIPALLLKALATKGWHSAGSSEAGFLPELNDADLAHALKTQADTFCQYPLWQGNAYETTVLNRHRQHPLIESLLKRYGNGLLTRFAARWVELAAIPGLLRQLTALDEIKPGTSLYSHAEGHAHAAISTGLSQIEAARGLLVHRMELARGFIQNYQIVAPTEWNFHPSGTAAQSLRQLPAGNAALLRQQAELVIKAIDPCVAFDLIIS